MKTKYVDLSWQCQVGIIGGWVYFVVTMIMGTLLILGYLLA